MMTISVQVMCSVSSGCNSIYFQRTEISDLDNQPGFPRITIGSCGEVIVNYLIFSQVLLGRSNYLLF